jgi:putative ABC transport system permease protein
MLLRDLRYAIRTLARSPGFSAVAALSIALAIGANSTIFTFTNAYLLRPLPYKDSERLRIVNGVEIPRQRVSRNPTYGEALAWREASQTADGVVAAKYATFNASETIPPEQVLAMQVSAGFFELLSARPHMGRTFTAQDDTPDGRRVVVLSYGYWQRTGARPDVLGQKLLLNGAPYDVVGVMPPSFRFPNPEWAIWVPLGLAADQADRQQSVNVMFRTKPGVTAQAAAAELGEIARRTTRADSAGTGVWRVDSWSLHEYLNHVPQAAPSILALQVAAIFVLLIACANLANLLLARSTARRREIAIRTAVGAGRGQLLRQLLVEACVLSACGGAAGIVMAYAGTRALVAVCPLWMLPIDGVQMDGRVLLFTAAASLIAGLVFGIVPATHASRSGPGEALKEGGRSTEARGRQWLRRMLVATEMAAAVVLVIGAALLIRTLHGANSDLGFRTDNVLTMDVALPTAKYASPASIAGFYREAVANLLNTPGVVSAGGRGNFSRSAVLSDGRPAPEQGAEVYAVNAAVTPDYFATLGIPLRSGRFFQPADTEYSQPVAIVNESLARRAWPGESAVGRTIKTGRGEDRWRTVIGVVGDTRMNPLEVARPEAYVPHQQQATRSMLIAIRTQAEPGEFAKAARLAVAAVDPHQAVTNLRTMEELVAFQVSPQRVTSGLMTVFAAIALALAAIGIYGVTAYSVSQRTHEFGVRMALGASRASIGRIVVYDAGAMAGFGMGVGLVAAFGLTRLMKAILHGVSATDPLTFVAVPATLVLVAISAAYVPAVRATRADPLKSLRCE